MARDLCNDGPPCANAIIRFLKIPASQPLDGHSIAPEAISVALRENVGKNVSDSCEDPSYSPASRLDRGIHDNVQ